MMRLFACIVLSNFSLLFCPQVKADESAVVFMYHRFGEDQYPTTSIRVDQFRNQLNYLRDGGFTVIPLARLVEFLSGEGELPPRAVVITVDDAYRSVYETAYPLLAEYGFPFTLFVSSDPVDRKLPGYLSWDQVRELAANGATISNHGAGHIHMHERLGGESEAAWQQRIVADIEKGWRRLAEELPGDDKPLPGVFAYPYGEYDTDVAEKLGQLGYISFGQQSGAAGRYGDKRALPRFPMAEAFAGMDGFRTKAMSLPMPVMDVEPFNPVTSEPLPEIILTLAESLVRAGELACYVSGQGKAKVRWTEPDRRFAVRPQQPLRRGRQRVNCTSPDNEGRYLWFSHQWIVR